MEQKDTTTHWRMGRAFVGVVLIFCGLVYLGVNLGIFDWSLWANMWRLWPLLFVALGLSMIARQRWSRYIVFIIFVLVAIFGLWLLWKQSEFQQLGSNDSQDITIPYHTETQLAKLNVDLPAATVRLSGPADTDKLVTGRVETRGLEHNVTMTQDGGIQAVQIQGSGLSVPFVGTQGMVDLQLSARVPFAIKVKVGKADATLDFTSLNIQSLDVESGASSVNIFFGDIASRADATIQTGASSIAITAPTGTGVRMHIASGVTSTTLDSLEKVDEHTFASKEYEKAEKQIMIDIQSGVSSVVFSYQ